MAYMTFTTIITKSYAALIQGVGGWGGIAIAKNFYLTLLTKIGCFKQGYFCIAEVTRALAV